MNAKTRTAIVVGGVLCLLLAAPVLAAPGDTPDSAPATRASAGAPQQGRAVEKGMAFFSVVLLALVGTAIGLCLLIVIQLVFPGLTSCGAGALRRGLFRSFLLGLATMVAIVLVVWGVSALSKDVGGLVGLVLFVLVGLIAFAVVSQDLGRRILERSGSQRGLTGQLAIGWLVFVGAGLTPFLGWFLIFPFLTLAGVGGVVQTLWGKKAPRGEAVPSTAPGEAEGPSS